MRRIGTLAVYVLCGSAILAGSACFGAGCVCLDQLTLGLLSKPIDAGVNWGGETNPGVNENDSIQSTWVDPAI